MGIGSSIRPTIIRLWGYVIHIAVPDHSDSNWLRKNVCIDYLVMAGTVDIINKILMLLLVVVALQMLSCRVETQTELLHQVSHAYSAIGDGGSMWIFGAVREFCNIMYPICRFIPVFVCEGVSLINGFPLLLMPSWSTAGIQIAYAVS